MNASCFKDKTTIRKAQTTKADVLILFKYIFNQINDYIAN